MEKNKNKSKEENRENTKIKRNPFKALLHLFKAPLFAIIMLILAVVCIIFSKVIPAYSYKQQSGKVKFINPENFCTSDSGLTAIADEGKRVYCLSEDGNLIYAIDIKHLPYENAKIIDLAFHNNDLYCHIAVYNKEAYLTDFETVVEFNSSGEMKREVIHYDYTNIDNPPSQLTRISGIHFNRNNLCYLYEENDDYYLMEIDLNNLQTANKINLKMDKSEFSKIMQCQGIENGGYFILKNNGEIATISANGQYNLLYTAQYNIRTETGLFPFCIYAKDDNYYMLASQGDIAIYENLTLYEWNGTDWEYVLPITCAIDDDITVRNYKLGLGSYSNKLALNINSSIYVLDDNFPNTEYCGGFSLPFSIKLLMWLKTYLLPLGILFLILGAISGIGNLTKWRFSLLLKQLFIIIPIILVMLTIIIYHMLDNFTYMIADDTLRETIGIIEIATTLFDDEELDKITGYESVNNGQAANLSKRLREFVNGNQSYWSKNYLVAIFVRTVGENYVCVASSDDSKDFMLQSFSTDAPIQNEFVGISHTFVADVAYGDEDDDESLHLILATPIYKEDGSYDSIVVLSASCVSIFNKAVETIKDFIYQTIIWVSLLIIAVTLVSAYSVRALRKAQNVVSRIANGDFSARVEKYSKDETGEICAGVNDMADRLSEYIKEKSRNEQFYYKFVPEKFKELLQKENFTDLALGDAQSKDLTILFCDIRAFSLNSEMMTAKESFEFVNRIYGKAGPIIRKHNGFVDKYIGDAVMALFECADDAVLAGIELYQAIVVNPATAKELNISSVNIGIGIHSGMAQIGIVGEDERMSGTVISNTVNLSSRMESLTKKYGTAMIISKDTMDRMNNPDMLATRYLGMVQVAGVNEVVSLYEVLDCLPEAQRKKREHTRNEFREAVRLYHSGALNQSLDIFRRLSEADDEDVASKLYLKYIENKLAKGETEHNVFRFERKQ